MPRFWKRKSDPAKPKAVESPTVTGTAPIDSLQATTEFAEPDLEFSREVSSGTDLVARVTPMKRPSRITSTMPAQKPDAQKSGAQKPEAKKSGAQDPETQDPEIQDPETDETSQVVNVKWEGLRGKKASGSGDGEDGEPTETQEMEDPIVAQIASKPTPVLRMRRSYDVQLPAGFLRALLAGILLTLVTWLLIVIPVFLVYRSYKTNPWLVPYSNSDALAFATRIWGWSLGDPLRFDGVVYTVWPLGLTLLWLLIFRWGLRLICHRLPGGIFFSVPGAVIGALIVFSASGGAVSPWISMGVCALMMFVATAWQWWGARRPRLFAKGFDSAPSLDPVDNGGRADAVPTWFSNWPASLRVLLTAVMLFGAALLLVSWRVHVQDVDAIAKSLGVSTSAGILLAILELAFLPNAIIYALAWASGAGFYFGVDTGFSLSEVSSGPIPAFPILGLLPTGRVGVWPILLLIVFGLVTGIWWHYRASRVSFLDQFRLAVVSAFAFVGALALLIYLSAGSLGNGRLTLIGPKLAPALGLITVCFFVPAVISFLFCHRDIRKAFSDMLGLRGRRLRPKTGSQQPGDSTSGGFGRRKSAILDKPVEGADDTATTALETDEIEGEN